MLRSALVASLSLLALLSLAACGARIKEPIADAGDALSPKRPEMLGSFTAMDLQRAPTKPAGDHPDLKIEVLAAGEGEAISYGMIGRFDCVGSLADGKRFLNTYSGDDATPAVLRLLPPSVPEGLALGLDGCRVGERRRITVPGRLGYGEPGDFSLGTPIPPHAMLIYEVELVEVVRSLAIKILAEGSGAELLYGQRGRFQYTGVRASDGGEFDASELPQEFSIRTSSVIAGWALGLPGMKTGEKRRLRIPSELAYGEAGAGSEIGPNEDLIFDVELVEILP